MSLDVRENFTEQGEPLIHASVCFLSVRHWAISRQSPKADFRMCLKGLLLAFRRHRVVYLLDLGHDSPCLLAQSSPRDSEIYGAGDGVIRCAEGCPAGCGNAAATWLIVIDIEGRSGLGHARMQMVLKENLDVIPGCASAKAKPRKQSRREQRRNDLEGELKFDKWREAHVPTRENYPDGLCGAGHKLNDLELFELVGRPLRDPVSGEGCCQLPTPRLRQRPAAACDCYRR